MTWVRLGVGCPRRGSRWDLRSVEPRGVCGEGVGVCACVGRAGERARAGLPSFGGLTRVDADAQAQLLLGPVARCGRSGPRPAGRQGHAGHLAGVQPPFRTGAGHHHVASPMVSTCEGRERVQDLRAQLSLSSVSRHQRHCLLVHPLPAVVFARFSGGSWSLP